MSGLSGSGPGTVFDQLEFDVRCEWGQNGVSQLAPISDVVIIVDVLSFSTSVEIATCRGAVIFPYNRGRDEAAAFAASVGAELAYPQLNASRYSLSPQSLTRIPKDTRLVLPSPNGSRLSLGTGRTPALAGCLRNHRAVAAAARKYGKRISIIPAGERWRDGSLRPAFEDWIGAGAIISQLAGRSSPEARAACAAFRDAQPEVEWRVRQCGSGQELIERGFEESVILAAALDISDCVPALVDGAYVRADG